MVFVEEAQGLHGCTFDIPSVDSLIYILKNCRGKKDLKEVKHLHFDITTHGLDTYQPVANHLLSLYTECASISDAEKVFNSMDDHNEYSWTSLIQGYVEHGEPEQALKTYEMMQEECFQPTTYTFVALLKACGRMNWVKEAQRLHAEIVELGYDLDPFVGSSLVHMYFKFGMLTEARDVLDNLPHRDVVLWTALITGYVEQGLCEEALSCLDEMLLEGMIPDPVTYVSCLKACGTLGALDKGFELHSDIIIKGFDDNVIVGNSLIDMYSKCSLLAEAKTVLHMLGDRDVISWNSLAAGYAEHGYGDEVLNLLEQMYEEGVEPDAITFVCCLKGCSSIGVVIKGQQLHADIIMLGFEKDPFIGSTLVDFYAKCGALAEARDVSDEMPIRDIVAWTALAAGYAVHGFDKEVLECFMQMQVEGVVFDMVAINTVMFSYAEQGEIEKILNLFVLIQQQGLLPNSSVFVALMIACGNTEAIEIGKRFHSQIHKMGLDDAILATAIIDMYCKCGSMVYAHQFFDMLPNHPAAIWNTLLTGYAHHGQGDIVFELYQRMKEGVVPDKVTILSVISACSHLGLVDKGLQYFDEMKTHGIIPTIKHYTCVVDLLCRAGQLNDAVMMIENMPIQPNLILWHILLSACHKLGNVVLGRYAFDHAVRLDHNHGAAYILMSNIYANANMLENVKEIEAMSEHMQTLKRWDNGMSESIEELFWDKDEDLS